MAKISIRPGASEAERQEIDKLARLLNERCGAEAECIIVEVESPCASEGSRILSKIINKEEGEYGKF